MGLVGLILRPGRLGSVLSRRDPMTRSTVSKHTAGSKPRFRGSARDGGISSKRQPVRDWEAVEVEEEEEAWAFCTISRDLERCRGLSLENWMLGMSAFRMVLWRRPWGEGLRLAPWSRLVDRKSSPWNLARLGLRLRWRCIFPGLGLRDLGPRSTSVLSSSSSEVLLVLSVALLTCSKVGKEI